MRTKAIFFLLIHTFLSTPSVSCFAANEDRLTIQLTKPSVFPNTVADLRLEEHPRLFVTQESLPKIRQKLTKAIYSKDVARLKKSKHPTDQALAYLLWDNQEAGRKAKLALLSSKKIRRYGGMEKFIGIVQLSVMYDWLFPLLSESEKVQAQERIRKALNPIATRREKAGVAYYLNNDWARGAAFETIAILALAGDSTWASNQLLDTYKHPQRFFSPYSGGAIDTLRSIALTSGGGNQAGHAALPGTGYESMFLLGAGLFVRAWATATGEDHWATTNYFEKLPHYLTYAYLHVEKFGETARQVLEYGTGLNSVKSAELSKWLLQRQGRAKYALAFRLLLGDLDRVEARSPTELNLPTSVFLDGADLVVSRDGWEQENTAVFLSARHWDSSRFEPESGLLSIYKHGKPVLVRGIVGKSGHKVTNTSGIWLWNERKKIFKYGTNGSTYWNDLAKGKIARARTAEPVLFGRGTIHQPKTLAKFKRQDDETVIAATSFANLLSFEGVDKVSREIAHKKDRVIVVDNVVANKNIRVLLGYRLVETPKISGNRISTESFEMTIKSDPKSRIYWSGGIGQELLGPTGEWHGKRKGGFVEGYGKKEKKVRQYGLGYLFIEPTSKAKKYEFTTTLTIK